MGKRKGLRKPLPKSGNRFQLEDIEPSPPDYNKHQPLFSLKHMPYQGRCCISRCSKKERSHILDKMQKLSQGTWEEIRKWSKKMGFEVMPHHRFSVALPSIFTPDVSILVARYNKAGRIAGFRENDIYHVFLVGKNLYSH